MKNTETYKYISSLKNHIIESLLDKEDNLINKDINPLLTQCINFLDGDGNYDEIVNDIITTYGFDKETSFKTVTPNYVYLIYRKYAEGNVNTIEILYNNVAFRLIHYFNDLSFIKVNGVSIYKELISNKTNKALYILKNSTDLVNDIEDAHSSLLKDSKYNDTVQCYNR